jgi:predicted RNA-binding Zn-ribbon protein involved in translation (DUF1610 family)
VPTTPGTVNAAPEHLEVCESCGTEFDIDGSPSIFECGPCFEEWAEAEEAGR